jgi:(p)ppGpp synthase/HD superfamily hydrolase
LKNGDRIEIITSNNIKPTEEWLSFVVTSRARNEITKFLKEERKQKKQQGMLKWKEVLRKFKNQIDDNQLESFLKSNFSLKEYETTSDFYIAISEDKIDLDAFINYILEFLPETAKKDTLRSEKIIDNQSNKNLPNLINTNIDIIDFEETEHNETITTLLQSLNIDAKATQIEFVAKDDLHIIKDIESAILKYNDVLITSFDYHFDKSKLYCKIIIESENEEVLKSVSEEIKSNDKIIKLYA